MKYLGALWLLALLLTGCEQAVERHNTVHVLWSQADTSHNNYRIPSLIVTKQNTVLAFAEGREAGDAGDIDILVRRSMDNGKTWGEAQVVWDDFDNTCGNPCPVIDHNTGRILLLMTWNLGTDLEHDIIRKNSDSTRIPVLTYSDDDGLTWSKPESLFESGKDPDWGWYATGPGVGIQLTAEKYQGRLVIPCNNSYDDPENNNESGFEYGAHVLLSDDGGSNWRMSEIIMPGVNESQVVELQDGVLMMNMRSYRGKASRALAFSYDGGEHWSEVIDEPQLVESICQASLINYGVFNDSSMLLFANPAVPFGRTHMAIKSSFDYANTWTNSKLIYSGPSAYSSLAKLPNGDIGIFFECGIESPYEKMVFVAFDPSELFAPGSLLDQVPSRHRL